MFSEVIIDSWIKIQCYVYESECTALTFQKCFPSCSVAKLWFRSYPCMLNMKTQANVTLWAPEFYRCFVFLIFVWVYTHNHMRDPATGHCLLQSRSFDWLVCFEFPFVWTLLRHIALIFNRFWNSHLYILRPQDDVRTYLFNIEYLDPAGVKIISMPT